MHRAKGITNVYTMKHLRDLLQPEICISSFEFNEGHFQSHRNGMVPHECTELSFCSRLFMYKARLNKKASATYENCGFLGRGAV